MRASSVVPLRCRPQTKTRRCCPSLTPPYRSNAWRYSLTTTMARRARPSSSRARDRERALDPPPPLGENRRRGGTRRPSRERPGAARGRPARPLPLDPVARRGHTRSVRPARGNCARARPARPAPGGRRRPRALPPSLRLLGGPLGRSAARGEPLGHRRPRRRPPGTRETAGRGSREGRRSRGRQLARAGAAPRWSSGAPAHEDPPHPLAHRSRRLRGGPRGSGSPVARSAGRTTPLSSCRSAGCVPT